MEEHVDLLIEGLSDYILSLLPNEKDKVLMEMESYAEKEDFPIIGPVVGHLLSFFTQLIRPTKILELGSGFGYSAYYFAKHSDDDTEIICTDGDKDNESRLFNYFNNTSYSKKITYKLGNALEVIDEFTEGEFDIIFNDIDKEDYPEAYKKSISKLCKGGLLITDNTIWYNRVVEDNPESEATKGVKVYNELAFNDHRVVSILIPIRDGVTISVKK